MCFVRMASNYIFFFFLNKMDCCGLCASEKTTYWILKTPFVFFNDLLVCQNNVCEWSFLSKYLYMSLFVIN